MYVLFGHVNTSNFRGIGEKSFSAIKKRKCLSGTFLMDIFATENLYTNNKVPITSNICRYLIIEIKGQWVVLGEVTFSFNT